MKCFFWQSTHVHYNEKMIITSYFILTAVCRCTFYKNIGQTKCFFLTVSTWKYAPVYCAVKNVNINVLFKYCTVSEYTKTIVLKKNNVNSDNLQVYLYKNREKKTQFILSVCKYAICKYGKVSVFFNLVNMYIYIYIYIYI